MEQDNKGNIKIISTRIPTEKINWDSQSEVKKKFGDDGKPHDLIALKVLWGVFWMGLLLTGIVAANHWICIDKPSWTPSIAEALTTVWQILIPIVTLVIGYVFGRKNGD